MALYSRFFGGSGVFLPQLKLELAAALTVDPAFTDALVRNGPQSSSGVYAYGLVDVTTDEADPQTSTETTIIGVLSAHTPNPNYNFTLADAPWEPLIGQTQWLSDVIAEGGAVGCLCFWAGEQWRRVSDNAIASTT